MRIWQRNDAKSHVAMRQAIEDGRHEETRTPDLYRVKEQSACNLLNVGASVAPISTQEHPKTIPSTLVSTLKPQKVEVIFNQALKNRDGSAPGDKPAMDCIS